MLQVYTNATGEICFSMFRGSSEIKASEMMKLEGEGNYTSLHLRNKKLAVVSAYTLKRFEEHLPDAGFVRPNKSTLLNVKFIKKFTPKVVVLLDGTTVKISRRRLPHVKRVLSEQFTN